MKRFLKTVFYTSTQDTTYRNQIISSAAALLIIILLEILLSFIELGKIINYLAAALAFTFFVVLVIFAIKMFQISDNKQNKLIRESKYVFKHPSIKIPFSDIEFWIINLKEPDIIYVKSVDKKTFYIEVAFDITGTRGQYYNKQLWLNDKNASNSDELIALIKEENIVDIDGNVEVCATFDMSKPEYFLKVIEDLKNKK